MELNNDLDKQYKKDKSNYEKIKQLEERIKGLKEDYKKEYRKRQDALTKKARAIEDNDKTKEKEADNEIKITTENIEKVKKKIEKIKESIGKSKEKVDSYINELSKDPEFKKQIDYILKKRYERGLEKVNKEKEQTDIIINICTEHPSLENKLKGMIRAVEELDKIKENKKILDDEMKKIVLPDDQDKLLSLRKQMNDLVSKETTFIDKRKTNKDDFMTFCQKSNVNIDEEILDKIIEEKRFAHDGKDDIQALKSLKRISKGYDKQKIAYEKSIEKISNERENSSSVANNNSTQINNNNQNNHVNQQGNNLPDRTYKWYQFGKRFLKLGEKKEKHKELQTAVKF